MRTVRIDQCTPGLIIWPNVTYYRGVYTLYDEAGYDAAMREHLFRSRFAFMQGGAPTSSAYSTHSRAMRQLLAQLFQHWTTNKQRYINSNANLKNVHIRHELALLPWLVMEKAGLTTDGVSYD